MSSPPARLRPASNSDRTPAAFRVRRSRRLRDGGRADEFDALIRPDYANAFAVITCVIQEEWSSDMTERMIEVNGVELCTEPFGDPAHRPILLVQGVAASMLWWDERFCRTLSDCGCFVIRYDHRDTGRSITYARARPGYTGADLVADAVGVLDAYGIPRAHVVGVSAGGAFSQTTCAPVPRTRPLAGSDQHFGRDARRP
jgi:hypothetical protein